MALPVRCLSRWALSAVTVGLGIQACEVQDGGYVFSNGGAGGSSGLSGGLGATHAGTGAGGGANLGARSGAGAGRDGSAGTAFGGASSGGPPSAGMGGGGAEEQVTCGAVVCANEASCFTTSEPPRCQCRDGYLDVRNDGSWCEDINECASENGGCDPLAKCNNTPGGFACGGCPAGYTEEQGECVDIDECAQDNGGCDALAECTNTPGGFSCGNCPFGYKADAGGGCVDIDECATGNGDCDVSAMCNNTDGGFTCGDCPAGHSGGGDTGCIDIDECATNNGDCDPLVDCTNKAGGFSCGPCPTGYAGTGASGCIDVDECATGNGGCDINAKCTNSEGSRTCACKEGYTGNGMTCVDVDECATSNGGCHANADCANMPGSRTCTCKSGYTGTGTTCADVNECSTNNGGCHVNANCSNTPGGRDCACKPGYSGNGITCNCAVASPECVNATTQRSCVGNTLTDTICTGPSPLCVAGQGCQSCSNVRCGTTCCAAPPEKADSTCTPTACSVQCEPGYHACNGTQSPCYPNDEVTKCGNNCLNCNQANATARCVSGACSNTCVGTALGCDISPGKPACGSWDFESNDPNNPTEGFTLGPFAGADWAFNASDGLLKVVEKYATKNRKSLAIGFNGMGREGEVADVKIDLCPGGVNLSNRILRLDLYAETASGSQQLSSGSNGNYVMLFNGVTSAGSGCDADHPATDQAQPFRWNCSLGSFSASQVTSIVLRFRFFEAWRGTFFIDNVRLE
jgi:hypothetical protein